MKKILLFAILSVNTFALTCSNSDGYQVIIDNDLRVELSTPSEVLVLEKAMSNGTYYFGNFSSGSVRSFTLDSLKGELKLIEKVKGTRINKQSVVCK